MTRPILLAALLLCSGCDMRKNQWDLEVSKVESTKSSVYQFQCGNETTAKCECVPNPEAR